MINPYAARLILLFFFSTNVLCWADGVCKKAKLPADYVAVGEFNSPECDDGNDPTALNAWEVAPVKDGLAVCVLPGFEVMGAKVAELLTCEHVVSEECSPRLDGLPNAIVLRSPAECAKRKLPDDVKLKCSASTSLTNGAEGYMVSQLTSPSCPPAPASDKPGNVHTTNAWLLRTVESTSTATVLAICADDHNIGSSAYIVRRFKNRNCPVNPRVAGAQEGLTGWMILLNQPPVDGKTFTLCEGFTNDSWKPFGEDWIGYHGAIGYSELCGGQTQTPNSFNASYYAPKGVWFADASATCLQGSWQAEQDDNGIKWNWIATLNGDELLFKRVDGTRWLTSKRYELHAGWFGTYHETFTTGGSSEGGYLFLNATADCKQVRFWDARGDAEAASLFSPNGLGWFRKVDNTKKP